MTYSKTILCLANSYKHDGRCIAGKEIVLQENTWRVRDWVRPVSNRGSKEINLQEMTYECSSTVSKMDAMEINFIGSDNHAYQKENEIINHPPKWKKKFSMDAKHLPLFLDNPLSLWSNGNSSYSGFNDRIATDNLNKKINSLYFIKPESIKIKVSAEGLNFGDNTRKVRAKFKYNNIDYWLTVTDPELKHEYLMKNNGEYDAPDIRYITISLGELHNGFSYKLVAGAFK